MQYVGRLVSSVYNSITPNINPATLSGAIDVIVVEKQIEVEVEEDNEWGSEGEKIKKKVMMSELSSTPFHVRFGKMSVLRPAERKVTLHLNNSPDPLPFAMKVGEEGEAFFVLELGEDEAKGGIPDDLVTSPIISATTSPIFPPDDQPEQDEQEKPEQDNEERVAKSDGELTPENRHRTPRKHLSEDFVEPLDLGLPRAETLPEIIDKGDLVEEVSTTGKANGRKEDLQYMLDMDGYKMTVDGEDLAFAEGYRFSNELPLSERHGGSGRHGHSEVLNRPHRHTPDQMSSSIVDNGETPNGNGDATNHPNHHTAQQRSSSIADNDETTSYLQFLAEIESRQETELPTDSASDKLPRTLDRSQTDSVLEAKAAILKKDSDRITKSSKRNKGSQTYAKTLRLTSDQLKLLNLRKGANTITFSVTSSFSGVATCTARIFLWDASHQIVVSDIDGTITKSDALGHVFTMIGRDWTHIGVAKLYTDIARNGYRIMYLTSRAIGQADATRDYLTGISQNNYKLPDGPVIMSPDRLMASLHREVILRKPEVFKMACLRDIARLFGADPKKALPLPNADLPGVEKEVLVAANGPGAGKAQSPGEGSATNLIDKSSQNPTPFYAGFGNRITDALSYRSVNIPSSRIFTIDSYGEVKMELLELAGYKSSYIHMTDLVDQMFPPITLKSAQGNEGKPEFNDFNYWRPEIGEFELPSDEDLMPIPGGSSPVSPALSARSIRSVKSNSSIKSGANVTQLGESAISLDEGGSSRLSRFGLGKLSLSRKGSAQTIAATSDSTSTSKWAEKMPLTNQSTNDLPSTVNHNTNTNNNNNSNSNSIDYTQTPSSPSSYGSGVTSWAAGWRRRAASPGATSNSSVQATSPLVGPVISAEPEDENSLEGEADDDVSSFGGDDREGEENDQEDSQEGAVVGEESMEDDDPLLATGEIQFEWRG